MPKKVTMSVDLFIDYCLEIQDRQSKSDLRVSEIYHSIEFDENSDRQLVTLAKKLKKALAERREIKVELSKVTSILQKSTNVNELRKAKDQKNQTLVATVAAAT